MSIQLNHTIVYAADKVKSAVFLTGILGLPAPTSFGPFQRVDLANGIWLGFYAADPPLQPQHYAFIVDETEFDAILGRIRDQNLDIWADPFHHRPGEINRNDGGRGVYIVDPDSHDLEVITRPYGGFS